MKEKFSIEGTFNGKKVTLTWDNTRIHGDKDVVAEYWKREKEYEGKEFFGLPPVLLSDNYHLNPQASSGLFFDILPDGQVVDGIEYYDDMLGKNDPPGCIY